jgi:hypothetical protein
LSATVLKLWSTTTSTTILHPLTKTEQYQYVILKDGARGRIVAPPTGAMFI